MTYYDINQYVENHLADDVAAYLDDKIENFIDIDDFFGGNNYLNEATVQAVMVHLLWTFVEQNETTDHVMIMTEFLYPGTGNRADIVLIHRAEDEPTYTMFMEVKADFAADSVEEDAQLLEEIFSTFDQEDEENADGYCFYLTHNGAPQVNGQFGYGIQLIPIPVAFPGAEDDSDSDSATQDA